jgi:hypothetical protein
MGSLFLSFWVFWFGKVALRMECVITDAVRPFPFLHGCLFLLYFFHFFSLSSLGDDISV